MLLTERRLSFKLWRSSATTSNRFSRDIGCFRDSCLRLTFTVLSSPRPTYTNHHRSHHHHKPLKLHNRKQRKHFNYLIQESQSLHYQKLRFFEEKKTEEPYRWPEHSQWVSPESLCSSSVILAGEIPSFHSFCYQYYKQSWNTCQRRLYEL